jgi:hypothetical protein
MRRLITVCSALVVAMGLFLIGSPAQAAVQGKSGAQAEARSAGRLHIVYPTRIRRGGSGTYTVTVTGTRRSRGEWFVMSAYVPKHLGSVRIISRPAHSSCGFNKHKWAVYCLVRLVGQDKFRMRFRLNWSYRYAGWYKVNHYAGYVDHPSRSVWYTVDHVGRGAYDSHKVSRTKIV